MNRRELIKGLIVVPVAAAVKVEPASAIVEDLSTGTNIGDDFTINERGDIRHVCDKVGSYRVEELHWWLTELSERSPNCVDENHNLDLLSDIPSCIGCPIHIELVNGFNIDDEAAKFFYDGTIVQDSGNTIYSDRVAENSNMEEAKLVQVIRMRRPLERI